MQNPLFEAAQGRGSFFSPAAAARIEAAKAASRGYSSYNRIPQQEDDDPQDGQELDDKQWTQLAIKRFKENSGQAPITDMDISIAEDMVGMPDHLRTGGGPVVNPPVGVGKYNAARANEGMKYWNSQKSAASGGQQSPQPEQQQQPQSTLGKIGGAALNTIGAVGNLLDLPGSSVRDVLSGKNPFDQWLDPFGREADKNRVSGTQMLRKAGLAQDRDTWGNFGAGLALELVTDPTTYLGGLALTRMGKVMQSIGVKDMRRLAKEMAEAGGKSPTWIGSASGSLKTTPNMILKHADKTGEKIVKNAKTAGGKVITPTEGSMFKSVDEIPAAKLEAEELAVVDTGKNLEVYKSPKESGKWELDAEATRVANQQLDQTALGMTPRKLKQDINNAHKTIYGKDIDPADMDKPLRSLLSVKLPFAASHLHETMATKDPQGSWDSWMAKQKPIDPSNQLDEASAKSAAQQVEQQAPIAKDLAKDSATIAAEETAAAQEAAQRSKVSPTDARSVLKTMGKTDGDLDGIADEQLGGELGKYGLIDANGQLKKSIGENATRVLHQAAGVFGPKAVAAFKVVETMAETWAKLNGKTADEFFTQLSVKSGDEAGLLAKHEVPQPMLAPTAENTKMIMRTGERIITGMKQNTIASFMHEVGHDARAMFDSKMHEQMNKGVSELLGVEKKMFDENGQWTKEAEEAFANAFEYYMSTGKAPVKSLADVFKVLKQWMIDTYKAVVGKSEINKIINPQLRATFDEMLGKTPGKGKVARGAPIAPVGGSGLDNVAEAAGDTGVAQGTKPSQIDTSGVDLAENTTTATPASSITQEAADLIAKAESGGSIPTFFTRNLEKIAADNGIDITGSMKPGDVIEALKEKAANPSPAAIPSVDLVNQAIKEKPLGVGGNASVYSIDDKHVVRVPKQVKGEILDDFKAVEHPLTKLGIEAGQEIAENSQGVTIRQKQLGEEAGLAIPKQVPEAQRNELYKSRVIKAADMPQEAYDKLAENIKKINDAGYGIDPSKSSNILIDSDNGKFNLVDVSENKKGLKQGLNDIIVMLMGNTYFTQFEKSGEDLTQAYRQIFDKASEAVKKAGANEELTSGGQWSKEKAGHGKNAPPDLTRTGTEAAQTPPAAAATPEIPADLSRTGTSEADTIRTNPDTIRPQESPKPQGNIDPANNPAIDADISGQILPDQAADGSILLPLGTKNSSEIFSQLKAKAASDLGISVDGIAIRQVEKTDKGTRYIAEPKLKAAKTQQIQKENPLVQAAKEPVRQTAEINFTSNKEHNTELNKIHSGLSATVGKEVADAVTPVMKEFVDAGGNPLALRTTIESMSAEEAAGFAAKIAGDKSGAVDELLQTAYHGTPHVFGPEMLVKMPDGSEKYIKAGEEIPEGAESIDVFPLGRFDLSRVSTGEGRGVEGAGQAYGFGAYAAQREGLARDYKKTLAGDKKVVIDDKPIAETSVAMKESVRSKAAKDIEEALPDTKHYARSLATDLPFVNSIEDARELIDDALIDSEVFGDSEKAAEKILEVARKHQKENDTVSLLDKLDSNYMDINDTRSKLQDAVKGPRWGGYNSNASPSKREESYVYGLGYFVAAGVVHHSDGMHTAHWQDAGFGRQTLGNFDTFEEAKKAVDAKAAEYTSSNKYYKRRAAESKRQLELLDDLTKSGRLKATKPGALYKLDVPNDDEVMFWDKPLSEQPTKVQEGLKKLGVENKDTWTFDDKLKTHNRSDGSWIAEVKHDWVDDNRGGEWFYGQKRDPYNGSIFQATEGYAARRNVNGSIESKNFESLRQAKAWIEDPGLKWMAAPMSSRGTAGAEAVFKSIDEAKRWLDETHPTAQPKGREIYEQLMRKAQEESARAIKKDIDEKIGPLLKVPTGAPTLEDIKKLAPEMRRGEYSIKFGYLEGLGGNKTPAHYYGSSQEDILASIKYDLERGKLKLHTKQEILDSLEPMIRSGGSYEATGMLEGFGIPRDKASKLVDDISNKTFMSEFASKKAASKMLHGVGIKGNAVPENFRAGGNKKGNYNFVVFDDKDIKILDRLEQKGKGVVSFKETGEAAVKILTGSGDASTAIHELGHVFRRNLSSDLMSKAETAMEVQLKDADTLQNILGGVKSAALKDASGKWTREAEEVWARLFEKYMRDGKAPTKALTEVFAKIKQMMTAVYRTLKGSPEINAKINDDLRQVFDEMLGAEKKPLKAKAPSNALADAGNTTKRAGGPEDNLLTETAGIGPKKTTPSGSYKKAMQEAFVDDPERDQKVEGLYSVAEALAKSSGQSVDEYMKANWTKTTIEEFKAMGQDGVLFQGGNDGLYYKTDKMLESGKVGGKVGKDQFLATAKKFGVKDEELDDLNIQELFKDGKPKTREEIRQWVDGHKVELKDYTLGDSWESSFGDSPVARNIDDSSKYERYQVAGGDSGTYREKLITVPVKVATRDEAIALGKKLKEEGIEKGSPQWHAAFQELRDKARNSGPNYKGPHFDQPNIIAHVRMDDVTLPNGKKALRVQEIQSDWHQAGAKQGYQGDVGKIEITDGSSAIQGAEKATQLGDARNPNTRRYVAKDGEEIKAIIYADSQSEAYDILRQKGIVDGPFKKSWPQLALKKVLQEAIENGYEEVQIVKGSDAAKAVGGPDEALSTFYDDILHGDMKKLTKRWGSFQGVGNNAKGTGGTGSWNRYSDTYLKLENEAYPFSANVVKVKDSDQWMARFVIDDVGEDNIGVFKNLDEAKNAAESYLKEEIKRHGLEQHGFSGDVQVFKITPEMRKDIMGEGLPMYQKAGKNTKGAVKFEGSEIGAAAKAFLFEGADASTVIHELGHIARRRLDLGLQAKAEKAYGVKGGKWSVKQEEEFARDFEAYMSTGKAPTDELKSVFAKMKEWMSKVYEGIKGSPLGRKLSQDKTELFDEMFGVKKVDAPVAKAPSNALTDIATGSARVGDTPVAKTPVAPLDPITRAAKAADTPVAKAPEVLPANPLQDQARRAVSRPQELPKPNAIEEAIAPKRAPAAVEAKQAATTVADEAMDTWPEAKKVEAVFGMPASKLPKETWQRINKIGADAYEIADGDTEGLMSLAREGAEEALGRKLTDSEMDDVVAWMSKTQDQFARNRERIDPSYLVEKDAAGLRKSVDDMIESVRKEAGKRNVNAKEREPMIRQIVDARNSGDIGQLRSVIKDQFDLIGSKLPEDKVTQIADDLMKDFKPLEEVKQGRKTIDRGPYQGKERVDAMTEAPPLVKLSRGPAVTSVEAAMKTPEFLETLSPEVKTVVEKTRKGKFAKEIAKDEKTSVKIIQERLNEAKAKAEEFVKNSGEPKAAGALSEEERLSLYDRMNFYRKQAHEATSKEAKAEATKLAVEARNVLVESEMKKAKAAAGFLGGNASQVEENALKAMEILIKKIENHDYTKGVDMSIGNIKREVISQGLAESGSQRKKIGGGDTNSIVRDEIGVKNEKIWNAYRDRAKTKNGKKESAKKFAGKAAEAFGMTPSEIMESLRETSAKIRQKRGVSEVEDVANAADISRRGASALEDPEFIKTLDPTMKKALEQSMQGVYMKQIARDAGTSVKLMEERLLKVFDDAKKFADDNYLPGNPMSNAKAAPKEAATSALSHAMAKSSWPDIIDSIKSDSIRESFVRALDVGENLWMSNPATRTFFRYFDKSVYGAKDYEGQEVARKRYNAYERAIFRFRETLAPLVQAVGKSRMFDEKNLILENVKKGMSKEEARDAAIKLLNDRNNDIIKFFEQKTPHKMDRELLGLSEEEMVNFELWLTSVKRLFPEQLRDEIAAGLAGKELKDVIDYFPRFKADADRGIKRKNTRGEAMLSTNQESQISRNSALRDIPGGTPILNELSIDKNISGIRWDEPLIGNAPSPETLDRAVAYLEKNFADDLLTDEMFKEDEITKEGMEKLRSIASVMVDLPKEHVEKQVPMFGRNFMHAIARYAEHSHAAQSIALAGQDLIIKNVIKGEEQYRISKLFRGVGMDRHSAYMNVIGQTDRIDAYKLYVRKQIDELMEKEKLTIDEDGKFVMGEKKFTQNELEESQGWASKYLDDNDVAVNADTYEAATYFLKPWSKPDEIGAIEAAANASLNLFKSMVTLPFPAFHVRNFTSGQAQNFFFGAYDPGVTNIFDPRRYLRPISQAWQMRNGGDIKNIASQLPKHLVEEELKNSTEMIAKEINVHPSTVSLSAAQRDKIMTEWLRREVFKYGITGDKQGYAAEKIGDTMSSLVSQLPGTNARTAKNLWGLLPARDPSKSILKQSNPMAIEGSAYPTFKKAEGAARPSVGLEQIDETSFYPAAVGEEASLMVEDLNRIAPFIAFLKQGLSPEEAARRVQKIQFDYSNLSETEKRIKQFVPFYNFASKATKLTFGDLITNPGGKQAWTIRATNRAQDPQAPIPEHIRRGVAIPLGKNAEGQDRYLSGFGLAFEDPLEMASFIHGDVKSSAASVLSKLRPGVQALPEMAMGRSLFFDREHSDLDPQVGRLRDNILGVEQKGLAEPILGSPGVEFLVGKTPAARAVSTANKLLDARKNPLERLANIASGVKITDVNAEAADRIRINQAAEELKSLGGRTMELNYVPDWRKERMSESELQRAEALQKLINSVKSDAKERKKNAQAESLRTAATGGGVG